jgi:hypothetical protein
MREAKRWEERGDGYCGWMELVEYVAPRRHHVVHGPPRSLDAVAGGARGTAPLRIRPLAAAPPLS